MACAVPSEMLTGSNIARSLVVAQSLCVTVAGWDVLSRPRAKGLFVGRLVPRRAKSPNGVSPGQRVRRQGLEPRTRGLKGGQLRGSGRSACTNSMTGCPECTHRTRIVPVPAPRSVPRHPRPVPSLSVTKRVTATAWLAASGRRRCRVPPIRQARGRWVPPRRQSVASPASAGRASRRSPGRSWR